MLKRDAGLKKAIEAAGSSQRLANMLRISLQAVWQWRRVPPLRVLQVEGATGVARHELRPDLYPPPTARRRNALTDVAAAASKRGASNVP